MSRKSEDLCIKSPISRLKNQFRTNKCKSISQDGEYNQGNHNSETCKKANKKKVGKKKVQIHVGTVYILLNPRVLLLGVFIEEQDMVVTKQFYLLAGNRGDRGFTCKALSPLEGGLTIVYIHIQSITC